jgi:autotransporter-associated beta strand protein
MKSGIQTKRMVFSRTTRHMTALWLAMAIVVVGSGIHGLVPSVHADVTAAWNLDANGNWSAGANWTGGSAPTGTTGVAYFTNAITAGRTVTVDASPWTIGGLTFSSTAANGFTLVNGTLQELATIVVNGSSVATVDSSISGSTGLALSGGGVLTLSSGTNTFTGPITVSEGSVLHLTHVDAFTNDLPAITLNNGSIGWKKAGGFTNLLAKLTPGSTGSLILYPENAAQNIDLTGFPSITVRFQGAFTYTGTITLDPAATELVLSPENGMVITYSQTPATSLPLIVNGVGNGMVDLTGNNSSWAGSITVNGGRLSVSQVNGLGDGTGAITINSNAMLRINAAIASSFTSRITSGSSGYISLQATAASVNIDLTGCPGIYLGTDVNGTVNYAGTITPTPDGVYRLGGGNTPFRGSANQGFVANLTGGVDTVIMQGLVRITNSTCTGNTIITNNGALYLSGDAAFGAVPASPTANSIQLDTGGAIRMGETPTTVTLNANRGVMVGSGGGEFHTWSARTLTVPGSLSGAGKLNFTDGGTTIFSGANNTYSGTMDIQAGSTIIGNGTTFSWNTTANVTGINGANSRFGINDNADLVWATDLGAALGSADITRNNFSLLKRGTGTLTVDVAQNYLQDTDIEGGMVKVANAAAIPSGIGKGNVDFANNAILDVNGYNLTLNAVTGAGNIIDSAGTATQITVGTNNNTWTLLAPITNSLSITKSGSGIMTITSRAYDFNRAVEVAGGAMVVPGTASLNTSLNLNGAGTTLSIATGNAGGTNGLTGYYYYGISTGNTYIDTYAKLLNQINTVTPSAVSSSLFAGINCDYAQDTSKINGGDNYVFVHHGSFIAETNGTYTFGLSSDDGSTLFIDGAMVVDNNGDKGYTATPQKTGAVYLAAGLHEMMMGMYEKGGGQGLTLFCQTPGQGSLTALPNRLLLPDPTRITKLSGTGKMEALCTNVTPIELVANMATTFSGNIVATQGISIVKSGSARQTMAGLFYPSSTAWNVRSGELEFTAQPNRGKMMVASNATVSLMAATPSSVGLTGIYYDNLARTSDANFTNLVAFKNYLAGFAPTHIFSTTYNGQTVLNFANNGSGFPPPYGTTPTFHVFWEGYIVIPQAGQYTFYTASDDGSALFIDGACVVNNNYLQGVTERSGVVTLSAGTHAFALSFFDNGGGWGFYVNMAGPTMTKQFIPNSMLIPMGAVSEIAGAGTYALSNAQAHELLIDVANHTFAGSLSGASGTALSKRGPATWTLTGDSSSFAGTLNVAGGTLDLSGTARVGGPLINNASILLNVTEDRTFTLGAGGTGTLVKNGATTVTLKLNGTNFEQQLTINAGRILFDNQGNNVTMTKQPIVTGTGSWGFVGAGNTTLSGGTNALSTVTGKVLIDTGKLTLMGNPVTEGLVVALDASKTNSIYADANGSITNWTSLVNTMNFSQTVSSNCPTYNPNAFNGRGAVVFGTNYQGLVTSTLLHSSKTTTNKTVFIVTRMTGAQSTEWPGIWGRTGNDLGGIRPTGSTTQWRIPGDGNDFCNGTGGRAFVNGSEKFANTEVGTTGHLLTQYAGNNAIWSTSILTSVGHYHYIGQPLRYYRGEIAELLVYDRYVTDAERAVIENYLNAKWLLDRGAPVTDSALPSGVSLEMANNGTLDLVGNTQTFTSITGSGTITNGAAIVTDDIRPGGTGVIGTLGFAGFEQQTATYYADLVQNSEAPCDQVVISGTGSVSLDGLTININPLTLPGAITRFKVMSTLGTFTGAPTLIVGTSYWTAVIGDSGKSLYLIYSSGTMISFQ